MSIESVSLTAAPSATSCAVSFSARALTVSVAPFVSPGMPFVGDPSRLLMKEASGAVMISEEEMRSHFWKCWSKMSSSSHPSRSP